jgi:Inner membrane component of T3SS, cytoplasmic domain
VSELTLLILRVGFLILLWVFVFVVVYSVRADLFGQRVRKQPADAPGPVRQAGAAAPVAAPVVAPVTPGAPVATRPAAASAPAAKPAKSKTGAPATTETVSKLVVTSGPKAGVEVDLGRDPLTIGRSSEAGLVIRDDYTSSQHARLMLWGEQWMLQDLDSTNGTWLDGERVHAPVPVKVGSPIKVGATTFELRA